MISLFVYFLFIKCGILCLCIFNDLLILLDSLLYDEWILYGYYDNEDNRVSYLLSIEVLNVYGYCYWIDFIF